VDVVWKALNVLDCFQVRFLLQLKKISELTGMNKSRIIQVCGTLVAKGYLGCNAEFHHYKPGSRILSLSKILAAPIYGHDGKVCAAISIAGPINRFSPEHNEKYLAISPASAEPFLKCWGIRV